MFKPMRVSLFAFLAFITLLAFGMGAIRLAVEMSSGSALKPIFGFLGVIILIGSPFIPFGYWRNGYGGAIEAACLGFLGLVLAVPVLMIVAAIFSLVVHLLLKRF